MGQLERGLVIGSIHFESLKRKVYAMTKHTDRGKSLKNI